jgi:prepilin signal peptidase PulO-like enzyme (type II secretory pathway)
LPFPSEFWNVFILSFFVGLLVVLFVPFRIQRLKSELQSKNKFCDWNSDISTDKILGNVQYRPVELPYLWIG